MTGEVTETLRRLARDAPIATAAVPVAAATAVCILAIDRPLALWIASWATPRWNEAFHTIAIAGEATLYIIAALAMIAWSAVGAWRSREELRRTAWAERMRWPIHALMALAISGLAVVLSKPVLGRLRPRFLLEEGLYVFEPFYMRFGHLAFPSGHSQTIWSLATVLMLALPRLRWPVLAVALSVSTSRLATNSHYLGDVIAGSFLGIATALLLKPWLIDRRGWLVVARRMRLIRAGD